METGIKACEIMNKNFLVLDSSLSLERCIKRLNSREEACLVVNNGYFYSILGYDELLKVFFKRKRKDIKLEEIKTNKNFRIINPETDVFDIISIIRNSSIDFFVVKDKNYLGLITRKEILEAEEDIVERIASRRIIVTT